MNAYGDALRSLDRPKAPAPPFLAMGGLTMAAACLAWGRYFSGAHDVRSLMFPIGAIFFEMRIIILIALLSGAILAICGRSRALKMLLLVLIGAVVFGAMCILGAGSDESGSAVRALLFYGGLCSVILMGAQPGSQRWFVCAPAAGLFIFVAGIATWCFPLADVLFAAVVAGVWLSQSNLSCKQSER